MVETNSGFGRSRAQSTRAIRGISEHHRSCTQIGDWKRDRDTSLERNTHGQARPPQVSSTATRDSQRPSRDMYIRARYIDRYIRVSARVSTASGAPRSQPDMCECVFVTRDGPLSSVLCENQFETPIICTRRAAAAISVARVGARHVLRAVLRRSIWFFPLHTIAGR